jgi:hypothetical protein
VVCSFCDDPSCQRLALLHWRCFPANQRGLLAPAGPCWAVCGLGLVCIPGTMLIFSICKFVYVYGVHIDQRFYIYMALLSTAMSLYYGYALCNIMHCTLYPKYSFLPVQCKVKFKSRLVCTCASLNVYPSHSYRQVKTDVTSPNSNANTRNR